MTSGDRGLEPSNEPSESSGASEPSAPSEDVNRRPAWITWLFADRKTGRLVFGQFPNLPLWIFLAAFLVQLVFSPEGTWETVIDLVGTAGLLWWALDEVLRGVNPWRRILGGAVTAFVLYGLVSDLLPFGKLIA